jgi:hypothetical protein
MLNEKAIAGGMLYQVRLKTIFYWTKNAIEHTFGTLIKFEVRTS